jgi:phospholipid/cholesterol/gamma-HCH transport system substrate-binding protein
MRFRGETLSELSPLLTRVAALTAIGIAAVALLLVLTRSDGGYEVNAVFDDARGLIEGGEVKAGSVNVGTVEEIEIGEDGLPHVRMSVDDDFRLQQGAFANIRLASNVGAINRYVDLQQGEGPELPDGATLGPSSTDQPVDLDLAVSTLDPETRRDLAAVIAGIDLGTVGRGADLDRALQHSANALGETADALALVAEDELALRTLVSQGRRVVGALAQDPAGLAATADELAAVLSVAGGRQDELRRTVEHFGPALTGAREALERTERSIGNLRDLVAVARPAVAELAPTADLLRPAIDALRPLLAEANGLIGSAPRQLEILAPVLGLAPDVIAQLGPVLDGFNPFLDHLRARMPEIVNFFILAGDSTSDFDANGHLIRTTAIPINLARHPNLIGPSASGAGSVRRPFDRTPGTLEGEPWEDYADSFIGGGKHPSEVIDPDEESP